MTYLFACVFARMRVCPCPDRIKAQLHFPGLSFFRLPSRLENDEGLLGAAVDAAAALLR